MSQDKECTSREWTLLEIRQADRSGTYVFAIERRSREWRAGPDTGGRLDLAAHLVGGPGADAPGRRGRFVGSFGGSYEDCGTGGVVYVLTGGNMLLDEDVRGLRLGSYLQNEVVRWVLDKSQHRPGRIKPIRLSEVDARTEVQRDRRNRFYEQFGIAFDWGPPVDGIAHASGRSRDALTTADLHSKREVHGVRVLEMLPGLRELVGKAWDAKADAARADRARRDGEQEIAVMRSQRNIAWAVAAVVLVVALLAAGLAGRAYALGSATPPDEVGLPDLALMMGAIWRPWTTGAAEAPDGTEPPATGGAPMPGS
ncbi:hypothetical protein H0E84_12505 [Luteimonas sp. SJ-92]|uniref:Uncharacterized protein n=1 Tax=Luteimonas salinisoli TaxID=2752307 RepID=A0A853JD39_9GAMM|nr:hypothetical protein [Luteimonas salinisoli]NZA27203.1 hypothetical protein [Luteimonas salinisoli]